VLNGDIHVNTQTMTTIRRWSKTRLYLFCLWAKVRQILRECRVMTCACMGSAMITRWWSCRSTSVCWRH